MFKNQMDKGALTPIDMKQTKYKILYLFIMGILLFWCLGICLFPVVWITLMWKKVTNIH